MVDVLELHAEIFGDHLTAGQDRDVLQHGLAAIAEARGFDGRNLQAATQLVDHECCQRFAFDIFSDDQTAACRDCTTASRIGSSACRLDELLLVAAGYSASSSSTVILSGLVMK